MAALLALLASLLWGAADFAGGTLSRRVHPMAVVGAAHVVGLVGLLTWATVTGAFAAPLGWLPWAIPCGLISYLGLAAFYAGLACGQMGVVAPISASGAVIPVVVGLLSGERPGGLQFAGIACALVGIVLASGPEVSERVNVPSIGYALLAALTYGTVLVLLAHGSVYSPQMTLVGMRVTSVLVVLGLAVMLRSRFGVDRSGAGWLLVVGIGDTLANALYAVASRHGSVALVAVAASLFPAVTVLLARQFHQERLRPVQVAGVLAVLAGVAGITGG